MRAVLLVVVAGRVAAQGVRGELVGESSAQPIAGGLVAVLDTAGRERARAMTDAAGRFTLELPGPGAYRLRALRIGYQSWDSPVLQVAAGEWLEQRIAMPEVAVELAAITVEGRSPCGGQGRGRPEDGPQTAALWEEATKALSITRLTIERRLFRFRTVKFERVRTPQLDLQEERRDTTVGLSAWPFSSVPAESLARTGFVRDVPDGRVYYGPDIAVLVSDPFLDQHCFSVERPEEGDLELIGLAFAPRPGRRARDITGVLWLDRRTAELRHLEFRYTNLEAWIPADRVGGRIEFHRLPTGAWVIRRWWIRMPLGRMIAGERISYLASIKEVGGEVIAVLTAKGLRVVEF